MKKIFSLLLAIILFCSTNLFVFATEKHIEIFVKKDCPVCKSQKEFLKDLKKENNFNIFYLDIYENKDLYQRVDKKFVLTDGNPIVPVTIIRNKILVGFNKNQTPKLIKKELKKENNFFTFKQILDDSFNKNNIEIIHPLSSSNLKNKLFIYFFQFLYKHNLTKLFFKLYFYSYF